MPSYSTPRVFNTLFYRLVIFSCFLLSSVATAQSKDISHLYGKWHGGIKAPSGQYQVYDCDGGLGIKMILGSAAELIGKTVFCGKLKGQNKWVGKLNTSIKNSVSATVFSKTGKAEVIEHGDGTIEESLDYGAFLSQEQPQRKHYSNADRDLLAKEIYRDNRIEFEKYKMIPGPKYILQLETLEFKACHNIFPLCKDRYYHRVVSRKNLKK